MSKTPAKPANDWRRMLAAVPTHNSAANVQEHDDCVAVIIKNVRPGYMVPPISWFVPFKPQKVFRLDPIGTFLWKLCDGKRSVEDIIDCFKDEYDLTFHEAKTAVTDYLKKLVQRGVLAIIMKD